MSYSSEVVRIARMKLAEQKANHESEQRNRLAEAYNRIPRLRQIDRELRLTMTQAVHAAFSGGDEGQAGLAKAREQNSVLKKEREQLIQAQLPAGWLDQSPACKTCGDTGYVGSSMCVCLSELCRQEQRKRIGKLSGGINCFDDFRLEYYPDRMDPTNGVNSRMVMERNLMICRRYAEEFNCDSGNMLFTGDTGLGKTFLSGCIAGAVADRGYSVIYESAPALLAKMEKAKFGADSEARQDTDDYTLCDLLIIDDLGTEMPSQFVNAAVYALINERLMTNKAMIISTNLTSDELTRRYTPQIASRLRGSFKRIPFVGEDIRILKNRGMI